jgi:hypothetical protein
MFDPTTRAKRGSTSLSYPRRPLPASRNGAPGKVAKAKRPPVQTLGAHRQRKLRARRKAGLVVFELPLNLKRFERVVRARENLPPGTPVSRHQIRLALLEGIERWSRPWLTLRRW